MLYHIKFPNQKVLHQFLQQLGATYTEVNLRTISVVCACSVKDIELAKIKFKANVTEMKTD